MIKVQKGAEPAILQSNKSRWTTDLLNLVSQHGSYDQIPKNEKDAATSHYRDPEILKALMDSNGLAKCVYCESSVDLTSPCNIEHFHPKSVYPRETFEWDNLFTCCSLCNSTKNDFDTYKQPFIHPENEDPEFFLTFDDIMYVPKFKTGIGFDKAENVIIQCNLQRTPLIQEHCRVLIAFLGCCDSIKENIEKHSKYVKISSKIQSLSKIHATLEGLKTEASKEAKYAGFMRYLLRKYRVIDDAVKLVNQNKSYLGLSADFDWGF